MPPSLALTAPPGVPRGAHRLGHNARLAVYAGPLDPPRGEDLADPDEAGLIPALFTRAAAPPVAPTPAYSDVARRLLALLCEIGPASPLRVAAELGVPLPECGRELALLEHRGLLQRSPDGARSLAGAGRDLITALF